MIEFGPEIGDHNLPYRGAALEPLGKDLVKAAHEICRLLLGLGFGHHKFPDVGDDEVEEIMATGYVAAVTSNAEFVMQRVPPDRYPDWPPAPGIRAREEDEQGGVRPLLLADRGGHLSTRTTKAPKKKGGRRKRPNRPEPWLDASCPPVFSSTILELPDNSKGVLSLKKVPYLKNEVKPRTWKWRCYSLLYGIPFFPRKGRIFGAGWNHGLRYFR